MTITFYLKVKIGKFLANIASSFIRDREHRHQFRLKLDPLNPTRCVNYLQRYTSVDPIADVNENRTTNNIWVCWLQGYENAPQIIRNCISSMEKYKQEGQQVVILTSDNYGKYVELPPYIIEKWKEHKISNAHFADIIRVRLMATKGGYWLDATCMLLDTIPPQIDLLPLFLFRSHGEFDFTYIQNCFLHSCPNNYVMRKWCAAIEDYWKHETFAIHYFVHHLLFKALLENDIQFRKEFEQVPVMNDYSMHVLQRALIAGKTYNESLIENARKASFIQKLSYKLPNELLSDITGY